MLTYSSEYIYKRDAGILRRGFRRESFTFYYGNALFCVKAQTYLWRVVCGDINKTLMPSNNASITCGEWRVFLQFHHKLKFQKQFYSQIIRIFCGSKCSGNLCNVTTMRVASILQTPNERKLQSLSSVKQRQNLPIIYFAHAFRRH